jgi:hypothetical protein
MAFDPFAVGGPMRGAFHSSPQRRAPPEPASGLPHARARTAKEKPVMRTRSPRLRGMFRVVQDARDTTVRSRARGERNDDDRASEEADRQGASK